MRGLAFKGRTASATQRGIATFTYLVSSPRGLMFLSSILQGLANSAAVLSSTSTAILSSMAFALIRRNEIAKYNMRVPYR